MKTLVFFGAARENGHTKQMITLLLEHLDGEVDIVDAYRSNIAPCKDCRYCYHKRGCSIKDDMQPIYDKIDAADNIVFASPVYFHSVTGPLKCAIDRLQMYWAARIRKDAPTEHTQNGAMLLVGGAPVFAPQFDGAKIVLNGVFGDLKANNIGEVLFSNSDRESLNASPEIAQKIIALAKKMNDAYKEQNSKGEHI